MMISFYLHILILTIIKFNPSQINMILGWSGSIRLPGSITPTFFSGSRMLALISPNYFTSLGVYIFPITLLKSSPPSNRKSFVTPV